jgi:hypothetical protein
MYNIAEHWTPIPTVNIYYIDVTNNTHKGVEVDISSEDDTSSPILKRDKQVEWSQVLKPHELNHSSSFILVIYPSTGWLVYTAQWTSFFLPSSHCALEGIPELDRPWLLLQWSVGEPLQHLDHVVQVVLGHARLLPDRAREHLAGQGSFAPLLAGHRMLSNMSSSDWSSPMQRIKSGGFLLRTMDDRRLSTTTPLLMPCTTWRYLWRVKQYWYWEVVAREWQTQLVIQLSHKSLLGRIGTKQERPGVMPANSRIHTRDWPKQIHYLFRGEDI